MLFDLFKKKQIVRNDSRKDSTVFIDLDGLLVTYKVDNFNTDSITVFPQAIKKLIEIKAIGCYIILITYRLEEDCACILQLLEEKYNFKFDQCVFNIPSGKRIVVSEFVNAYKAHSFNARRNMGLVDLDITTF